MPFRLLWLLSGCLVFLPLGAPESPACCPAPPSGQPVVNADQTVVILWDAATKTQHFIRKASFKSEADDFGFVIPSPTQPELAESSDEVFSLLERLTAPQVITRRQPSGMGCGCGATRSDMTPMAAEVTVLEEKLVAGFNATVLDAQSAEALVAWLTENGYAFSPEIEAWAKPYVDAGWKFTALKVAKGDDAKQSRDVAAAALRMSFQTDRPLFPYREPDSSQSAQALGASSRLLRIYFLAEARYQGELTQEGAWTGTTAWADKLSPEDRSQALAALKLPETTGPAQWWLTEFEDRWPYRVAPSDLYFSTSADQDQIQRPAVIHYVSSPWPSDGAFYALAAVLVLPQVVRYIRRRIAPA